MGRRATTEGVISSRKAAEDAARRWATHRGGEERYYPALIDCGRLGFLHVRWKRDMAADAGAGGFHKMTWHDYMINLEDIA